MHGEIQPTPIPTPSPNRSPNPCGQYRLTGAPSFSADWLQPETPSAPVNHWLVGWLVGCADHREAGPQGPNLSINSTPHQPRLLPFRPQQHAHPKKPRATHPTHDSSTPIAHLRAPQHIGAQHLDRHRLLESREILTGQSRAVHLRKPALAQQVACAAVVVVMVVSVVVIVMMVVVAVNSGALRPRSGGRRRLKERKLP